MTASEMPALCASERFSACRMTKPESQKTGMDTTYPAMAMARGAFLLPTIFRMARAMTRAAPVFSRE